MANRRLSATAPACPYRRIWIRVKYPNRSTSANGIFRSANSKTLRISSSFIRQHVVIGGARLQQSIAKKTSHEIMVYYQMVIDVNELTPRSPVFEAGAP
jgi:hypothetical protein